MHVTIARRECHPSVRKNVGRNYSFRDVDVTVCACMLPHDRCKRRALHKTLNLGVVGSSPHRAHQVGCWHSQQSSCHRTSYRWGYAIDKYLKRGNAPTLFYQIEGDGPPVMLIHGVGADGSSWDAIAPALVGSFAVLRLDLRGHGRSGHIDSELSLGDFTRDVIDVPTPPAPRARISSVSRWAG